MKNLNSKGFNYFLLLVILSIQTFCYYSVLMGGRSLHGNISVDLGGVSLLIYSISILKFSEVVKYFLSNVLWTIGIFVVFQNNITSVSGAILMSFSVFLYWRDTKEISK